MLGSGLMMIFSILTLWHPARSFAKSLTLDMGEMGKGSEWTKLDRKEKWAEFLKRYKSMRDLATLINAVVGNIVTLYLCSSIISYGLQLDQALTEFENPKWRRMFMYGFNFITDVLVYILGAQVCHNVS